MIDDHRPQNPTPLTLARVEAARRPTLADLIAHMRRLSPDDRRAKANALRQLAYTAEREPFEGIRGVDLPLLRAEVADGMRAVADLLDGHT